MDFSGRTDIVDQIKQCVQERGSRILVLYGEKGLGKTALLLQLAQKYESVYYHAVPASEFTQAGLFLRRLGETRRQPDIENAYHTVFTVLTDRFRQPKLLLLIDESEHILKAGDQFTSALRVLLNHGYSDTDFLVLLSCSSLSFVANSLGKRLGICVPFISGIHKLRAFSFTQTCAFLKGYSVEESFLFYAILGGNPSLLTMTKNFPSAERFICEMFLKKTGVLHEYGLNALTGELREFGVYATILYPIACGKNKLNEIHLATGFSRAKISVYLKNLMELNLIEKVYSYGAGPRDDSKKGLYRISQPAVEFWYRFLYAAQSVMPETEPEAFYEQMIAPNLPAFMERAYARACAQALIEGRVFRSGHILRCEEWNGKSGEIPVVAITEQGDAIPIFVHYGVQPLTVEDTEWYAFSCKKARLSSKNMLIFSEGVPDEAVEERAHVMSLFSLYKK